MKSIRHVAVAGLLVVLGAPVAQQVACGQSLYIRDGHARQGTYVHPHVKTQPDAFRMNNLGQNPRAGEINRSQSREIEVVKSLRYSQFANSVTSMDATLNEFI